MLARACTLSVAQYCTHTGRPCVASSLLKDGYLLHEVVVVKKLEGRYFHALRECEAARWMEAAGCKVKELTCEI